MNAKDGEMLFILNVIPDLQIGYAVCALQSVLKIGEMMGYIVPNLKLMEEELAILYGMKINVIKKMKM